MEHTLIKQALWVITPPPSSSRRLLDPESPSHIPSLCRKRRIATKSPGIHSHQSSKSVDRALRVTSGCSVVLIDISLPILPNNSRPSPLPEESRIQKDLATLVAYLPPNYPIMPAFYTTPPYLSSTPQVVWRPLVPSRDYFLILATDGLWDMITPKEAVDVVARHWFDYRCHLATKRLNVQSHYFSKSVDRALRVTSGCSVVLIDISLPILPNNSRPSPLPEESRIQKDLATLVACVHGMGSELASFRITRPIACLLTPDEVYAPSNLGKPSTPIDALASESCQRLKSRHQALIYNTPDRIPLDFTKLLP
ncbi:hypothetical protein CSKR_100303 [Clonorchis sinensis]|uniref:PPM-type phosphatase domain-containing protein n=1 Tax=Clonorchis sinensis TaxID=79923 RepID=A0A8T1MJY4_CLOSI|nr:hypothetical protein CSKR_100303 [Clonorchis sinensis]